MFNYPQSGGLLMEACQACWKAVKVPTRALYCQSCNGAFHLECTPSPVPLATCIAPGKVLPWRCPGCIECSICRRKRDPVDVESQKSNAKAPRITDPHGIYTCRTCGVSYCSDCNPSRKGRQVNFFLCSTECARCVLCGGQYETIDSARYCGSCRRIPEHGCQACEKCGLFLRKIGGKKKACIKCRTMFVVHDSCGNADLCIQCCLKLPDNVLKGWTWAFNEQGERKAYKLEPLDGAFSLTEYDGTETIRGALSDLASYWKSIGPSRDRSLEHRDMAWRQLEQKLHSRRLSIGSLVEDGPEDDVEAESKRAGFKDAGEAVPGRVLKRKSPLIMETRIVALGSTAIASMETIKRPLKPDLMAFADIENVENNPSTAASSDQSTPNPPESRSPIQQVGVENNSHATSQTPSLFTGEVPAEQMSSSVHFDPDKACWRTRAFSHHPKTDKVSKPSADKLCSTDHPNVFIGRSAIAGWGLFARRAFKAGDPIIDYQGEIIGKALADHRERLYLSDPLLQHSCYLFTLCDGGGPAGSDGWVIDATRKGNQARFINHSCAPNCTAKVVSKTGRAKADPLGMRIVICAKQDIPAGAELSYDYKFSAGQERVPCACGTPRCRKYI